MSDGIDVGRLGGLLTRHLASLGLPLTLADETTGETHRMQVETAGAADGALPIFLAAADAVCREALRLPIGIDLQPGQLAASVRKFTVRAWAGIKAAEPWHLAPRPVEGIGAVRDGAGAWQRPAWPPAPIMSEM